MHPHPLRTWHGRIVRHVRALRPIERWNEACRRLASSEGQGTVEYVGIVLVVAALLIALKGGLGDTVGTKVGSKITSAVAEAIDTVIKGKGG